MANHISLIGSCVLLSVSSDSDREDFELLRVNILSHLHDLRRSSVVFDFSGVQILDETEFGCFRRLAEIAALLGARVLLAGLRPNVVAYLIMVEADTSGLEIVASVDDALVRLGLMREEQL